MEFQLQQEFSAPLGAVEAAYLDPDLLARLAALPDLGHPELLEHIDEDDTVRRRVRYQFTGHLGGAVTAVVDRERLTWVEESVHDRATHRGAFRIHPDHYGSLLQCSGTVALVPAPAGTTRRTAGVLSVRFPLLGGQVERAIVSGLRDHAAAEARVVQQWLDEAGRR